MNQPNKFPLPPANDADALANQSDQKAAADVAPIPPIETVRENFPKIADRIELLWGTWELQQYFTRIIIDDRGNREGFPVHVLSAILKIYQDHCKIAPTEDPTIKYKKMDKFWPDQ